MILNHTSGKTKKHNGKLIWEQDMKDLKHDILMEWIINKTCNYRCGYCFISRQTRQNQEYKGRDIEKIINGFNRHGLTFWIHMSGGEPFLQPNFVELCNNLTKKHYISINSNISTQNVYEFADSINPKRIMFIHCSLHIEERNSIYDFIKRYNYLKDRGFEVFASQVMYPPILDKSDQIFDIFKDNDIILKPKTFRGIYRFKPYPKSYTKEQRDRILKYIKLSEENNSQDSVDDFMMIEKLKLYGKLSFKDIICRAGKDFLSVDYDGDITRCSGESIKLGNLFEGKLNLLENKKPCRVKFCPCPYWGLAYSDEKPKVIKDAISLNIKDLAIHYIGKYK